MGEQFSAAAILLHSSAVFHLDQHEYAVHLEAPTLGYFPSMGTRNAPAVPVAASPGPGGKKKIRVTKDVSACISWLDRQHARPASKALHTSAYTIVQRAHFVMIPLCTHFAKADGELFGRR